MAEQFHVKNQPFPNMQWATMSFQMGAAFLPPILVPLSESWGRMPGYGFGYALYIICLFPSAFAQNFATLIVTRFFGGGAAAATINIVGGTISDIWRGSVARSRPMSLYVFAGVAGIAIGPCIGGGLQRIHFGTSWRWYEIRCYTDSCWRMVSYRQLITDFYSSYRIFYCQIIWGVALIPLFYSILYETRGDVILAKRAKRLRQQTGRPIYTKSELEMPGAWERLKSSTTRPTRMLITEPVVTFFTLWVSFAWGILFLFFDSVYNTFHANYKWDIFTVGLAELSILVGAIVGITFNPIQDAMYRQSAKRNKETDSTGKPIPEARLYTSIPGSLLFAGGLFWYGWGSVGHGSVHWIVPTLGIGCTGIGIYSILMTVINYLTDAYERYAASALSATSLGRNVMSGLLPLSSPALFEHLGFGWAGTLLGFIGVALSIVPVVLVLKGPEIRQRSPFMKESTFD